MEGLARPALRKGPEDMAVGNNQHIAVDALSLPFAHDGPVPFLPDLLNKPIKAFRNVGWAPVVGVRPKGSRALENKPGEGKGRLTLHLGSRLSRCPTGGPVPAASAVP